MESSAQANGVTVDLSGARQVALRVVVGQAGITLLAAVLFWALSGSLSARSALLGGAIGTLGTSAMTLLSFGARAAYDAHHAMRKFFVGEAVKLVLVILLFVLVLKLVSVSPVALLVAYIATFFVYWVPLLAALRSFGAPAPAMRIESGSKSV